MGGKLSKSNEQIDLFKGKKEEVINKLSEKGYNEKEIKDALEKIKQKEKLDNQIKNKLDSLKAGSQEHINYIESLLKDAKKDIIDKAKENIQKEAEKVKKSVEKKTEEVVDNIKDKAVKLSGFDKISQTFDKITNSLSGFFDKISNVFDTIWKKILAMLGIGTGVALTSEKNSETEEKTKKNNENNSSDTSQKANTIKKETSTKNSKAKEIKETNDTKKEIYYITGIRTLLSLSGIEQEKNIDDKTILKNISQNKYDLVVNLKEDEKSEYLDGNPEKKKTLDIIIEQLKSKNFVTIANYTFNHDRLKNIIEDENGNINENLANNITGGKERLEEILEKSNNSDKEWWQEELSIAEIALLYENSFNVLKIPSFNDFEIKSAIGGLLFDTKEIKETNNNFVSKNIIENFIKKYGLNFGGKNLDDNEVLDKISNGKNKLNEKEIEQLEKIIEFKNYITSDDYLLNIKPEIKNKKLFLDNLNYKWIITLYSIMGGKEFNPDSFNVINKLSLVYVNSKILGGFEGSQYIGNILYKIITEDTDYFTDDELEVLGIYKDKAYNMLVGYKLIEIGKSLGFASGATNIDLNTLALELGIGGAASYIIGGKLISKGIAKKKISILGVLWKKVGFFGMIGGLALGSYSFFNSNHIKNSFESDLKAAGNDDKKILEILDNYEKSIKNKKIDGKNISIIKYKNDTPLVLMDGKVYIFDIIDAPFLDKIQTIDYSKEGGWQKALDEIIKTAINILPDSSTVKINGKIIDRADVNINGDEISFGKKGEEKTYSLDELFNGISNKEIEVDESTAKKIKEYARKHYQKEIPFINGKDTYFYKLKDLGEGKYISLVQIGEIPKKYQKQEKNGE